MADYDAIVVGSGAGGLSASLKLARGSRKTLLLEAMPNFGGYINPFRRNGYTFDTGLHYLGELSEGEFFSSLLGPRCERLPSEPPNPSPAQGGEDRIPGSDRNRSTRVSYTCWLRARS